MGINSMYHRNNKPSLSAPSLCLTLPPTPPPNSISLSPSPGVGSLLSPSGLSGDEESCISDHDSPLSPLSNASSIGGSSEFVCTLEDDTLSSSPPVTDGDDFIETDYPSSPSHYSPPAPPQQVLTIPGKEKPPAKQKKKVQYSLHTPTLACTIRVCVYVCAAFGPHSLMCNICETICCL